MIKLQIALANGQLVMCRVLERSFEPGVDDRTCFFEHEGKELMARYRLGAWREAQPIIVRVPASTYERPWRLEWDYVNGCWIRYDEPGEPLGIERSKRIW